MYFNFLSMISVQTINSNLEKATEKFEDGRILEICESVESWLSQNEHLTFIDFYRNIIRNNVWLYNDSMETSFENLLERWNSTQLNYIESANEVFEFLRFDKGDFSDISQKVIISETLRGREGKRSKIGLDSFLAIYIKKLDGIIQKVYSPEEKEDILNLIVSTMSPPYESAETELYNLFYEYNKKLGKQVTYDNFETINSESNGLVSKLLREFCKYSFVDFNNKLSRFNFDEKSFSNKKKFQQSILKEKAYVKNQVKSRLKKEVPSLVDDFDDLLVKINDLNYLNANIEVKYSFKGWPGLFHYFIFKKLNSFLGTDIYQKNVSTKFTEVLQENEKNFIR